MPESRMVTLSDGPGWGLEGSPSAILSVRRGARARRTSFRWPGGLSGPSEPSRYMTKLAAHVAAECESPEDIGLAAAGYERLAALTLSRKLADGSYVGSGERASLLRAARLPTYLYANPATEAIFAASAEHLGKGGFIGQVGKAISKASSGVSKAFNRAIIPVNRSFQAASNITQGLMNDLQHAVSGVGKNVADFAASPQGTGAILGALTGDPGLGPIGAGAPGAPGYDASGQPLPKGTQYQPNTLLYAGLAALALVFLLSQGGRRR